MSTPPAGAVTPWNPLAIISFVAAFALPPVGIVCGHIALAQLRRSGEQGHGLALAGTILGWVFTGLIALLVIAWVLFFVVFLGIFAGFASSVPTDVATLP